MPQVLSCEMLPVPGGGMIIVIICGILNIIPNFGFGTLVAAIVNGCAQDLLITWIAQFLCCFLLFGVVWSVISGVYMLMNAT